jgi:hypothetical protein
MEKCEGGSAAAPLGPRDLEMFGFLGSLGDLCENLTFRVRHTERILRRFTIGRILGEGWWSFDGITEFSELTEWGGGCFPKVAVALRATVQLFGIQDS